MPPRAKPPSSSRAAPAARLPTHRVRTLGRIARLLAAWAVPALTPPLAHAEIHIGVSLPLSGPAASLGIPMSQGVALWPRTLGGESVRVTIVDDAADPSRAVQNARRFTETADPVDILVGSGTTPATVAMSQIAHEHRTVQLALAPAHLPAPRAHWVFSIPYEVPALVRRLLARMTLNGDRTLGFLGYGDAFGEQYLDALRAALPSTPLQLLAIERFARADPSVAAQTLRLATQQPDAVLIVASGGDAATPHAALTARDYRGHVYQTPAAAVPDLLRLGGSAIEGGWLLVGPVIAAEQLPDVHPAKAAAVQFVRLYEARHGQGQRNQQAAFAYDVGTLLATAVPLALQHGRPGTAAFRAALRDVLEQMPAVPTSSGSLDFTATRHFGAPVDATMFVRIDHGRWRAQP